VKLYGPFTSARTLRQAIQVLQRIFQFRTCTLDIKEDDDRWRWFGRACCTRSGSVPPVQLRVSKEDYRKQIRSLRMVMEGKRDRLIREMERDERAAAAKLDFERAARLRDDITALRKLSERGQADKDVQPEVFPIDPKRGLVGLRKVLGLEKTPRTIEGVDIAHLAGEDTVASLVSFIDGLPFKAGYRRFKIQSVEGIDDFASIQEVVTRRFRRLPSRRSCSPTSCSSTAARASSTPPRRLHAAGHRAARPDLAGQARGGDLPPRRGRADPPAAQRRGPAAAAVRPRRGAPLRAALPPHPAPQEDQDD